MKALLEAVSKMGQVLVQREDGQVTGSGLIATIGNECTVDDCHGGAFFFPVRSVKSVTVDLSKPTLIVIDNPTTTKA